MVVSIEHIMKGRIKMKGLMKLFSEYTLSSEKGNPLRYGYSQMIISGAMQSGKFIFTISADGSQGREKLLTPDLAELLDMMKAYAPAKDWKLVKKTEA